MGPTQSPRPTRKQLGAWATPPELVDRVVEHSITAEWVAHFDRPIRVVDPACGDGRFLTATRRRIAELGGRSVVTAVDVDPSAIDVVGASAELVDAERRCVDALTTDWSDHAFDLVIGNPPYLSQLASATSRRGSSAHGGGPYADAAAEFLALAVRLAAPDRGRIAFVLPQSILAARDAGTVRARVERSATMTWSWWSPRREFDADVLVCALTFERTVDTRVTPAAQTPEPRTPVPRTPEPPTPGHPTWSHVVIRHLGIPDLPLLRTVGTVGDRAQLNANFRDEYYGLVPAVGDHTDGPPLITSGLIDPGTCRWGERPVRFAKRGFAAPRVDVSKLDPSMRRWAERKLVPKVLVASQTAVVEAVVDEHGAWLPGVPVTSVMPDRPRDGGTRNATVWEVGAVLTSPIAALSVWHRLAGTGLSARAIRLGPSGVAAVPWPTGPLDDAVVALRRGDLVGCGRAVTAAFGVDPDDPESGRPLLEWWIARLGTNSRT